MATSASTLSLPQGVAADTNGDVYVVDSSNNRVLYYPSGSTTATRVYGQNGDFTTASSAAGADALNNPSDIAIGASGIYIVDSSNSRVLYYSGQSTPSWRHFQSAAPSPRPPENLRFFWG
jgi:hypothetical protein